MPRYGKSCETVTATATTLSLPIACLMHNSDYSLNNSTTQQLEDPGFQPEVPKGPIYKSVQLWCMNLQCVVHVNEKV